MNSAPLSHEEIRSAPKVVLHEHLDGGLRPQTLIDICREVDHDLPTHDSKALADWFFEAANSGSLERYLETFAHTVAAMQTPDHCARVAAEAVQDLAADGVVYAELRYAPEQQLERGMSLGEVVEATVAGLAEGERRAAAAGHTIQTGTILCGMRHADRVKEIAELAVAYRDKGVVGFDIAGAERGFPPEKHRDAFDYLRRECMPFTIHAGESAGLDSILGAVADCGAARIGHGVRITDDIETSDFGSEPGRLASHIRDRRIALEVCPSSNLQTGAAESIRTHPVNDLYRLGFAVTVNNDNRLMSRTHTSREFHLLSETFDWSWDEIERCTVNAAEAAFLPYGERLILVEDVIRPSYAALKRSA